MAIDFREIELSDDQKRHVARLAEETGQTWSEVLEQQLAAPVDAEAATRYWSHPDRYIRDRQKRIAYFREWASQRSSYNPNFDDSRESIYPDRG